MRHNAAAFGGAFFIALLYATKPVTSPQGVTMSRVGDTALVIDTGGRKSGWWVSIIPGRKAPGATDTAYSSSTVPPGGAAIPPASGVVAPNTAIPPAPGTIEPLRTGGSSTPAVSPADLLTLRNQAPVIPVAGVTAAKLIDSFDDMRGGTRRHNAIDIMAARNTPVVAAAGGSVLKLHNSAAGGLTIYTTDVSQRYVFMYGHLESFRPGIKEGASVNRGEIIGFVGSSGNASPVAPHLHFAIYRNDDLKGWWKGTPLNPFLIYRGK
ncbi:MAG TPA: M23 family metallopeptidase [Gemmatimonadaceae bacterium]|nr:M23 family metallopeptidase [Gemmatimonadaceae bacterium]